MTVGPGKYDDACTLAREHAGALATLLIVIGGRHGSGFSLQALSEEASASVVARIPALLRVVADDIEQDILKNENAAR
jgi:hypothetical protein